MGHTTTSGVPVHSRSHTVVNHAIYVLPYSLLFSHSPCPAQPAQRSSLSEQDAARHALSPAAQVWPSTYGTDTTPKQSSKAVRIFELCFQYISYINDITTRIYKAPRYTRIYTYYCIRSRTAPHQYLCRFCCCSVCWLFR